MWCLKVRERKKKGKRNIILLSWSGLHELSQACGEQTLFLAVCSPVLSQWVKRELKKASAPHRLDYCRTAHHIFSWKPAVLWRNFYHKLQRKGKPLLLSIWPSTIVKQPLLRRQLNYRQMAQLQDTLQISLGSILQKEYTGFQLRLFFSWELFQTVSMLYSP